MFVLLIIMSYFGDPKIVQLGPLDEQKTSEAQYKIFKSEMDHFFSRYPDRKIENTDLV